MVDLVGVAATTALSALLAVAAMAKLREREGTEAAATAFGLGPGPARVAALVLPWCEGAVALALWVPALHRGAALGAVALLATFSVGVAIALVRGRRVACACFGALADAELGPLTLLRNGALGALALGSAATPVWPAVEPGRTVAVAVVPLVLLVLAVAFLARTVVDLLARYGELLEAQGGPAPAPRPAAPAAPPGTPLSLRLRSTEGDDLAASALFVAPATLLVAADPGCRACRALTPELAAWAAAHPEVPVVVAARVPMRKAQAALAGTGALVAVDPEETVAAALGGPGFPAAVLVADDGRTASPVAVGVASVRDLLEAMGARPRLGDVRIVVDEGARTLGEQVGPDADLLLVSPSCPHCRRLAEEVATSGTDLGAGGSGRPVVVVSTAGQRATSALGLDAPTVHDLEGAVLSASGAPGTPALVPMADGRVAAPVVAGAPAVLAALAARSASPGRNAPSTGVEGGR